MDEDVGPEAGPKEGQSGFADTLVIRSDDKSDSGVAITVLGRKGIGSRSDAETAVGRTIAAWPGRLGGAAGKSINRLSIVINLVAPDGSRFIAARLFAASHDVHLPAELSHDAPNAHS
jgi:hypothetical protein